jgi:iron transport multicopper oxidase
VSQCPLQPGSYLSTFGTLPTDLFAGKDLSYTFQAGGQSGTYWYHSMHSTQYCDGLRGGMVIYDPYACHSILDSIPLRIMYHRNDPFKGMYDVDDASTVITLADWYHNSSTAILAQPAPFAWPGPFYVSRPSGPQQMTTIAFTDSTLINGLGRAWSNTQNSALSVINVAHGTRYRLRIISLSCFPAFALSIDNHKFTIIEADGVPYQPHATDNVTLYAGQRYSAILTADQPIGNYWIRALPVADGLSWPSAGPFTGGINSAILRYAGASSAEPTTPFIASYNPLAESTLVLHTNLAGVTNPGTVVPAVTITLDDIGFKYYINGELNTLPATPVLSQLLSGYNENLEPANLYINLPANSIVQLEFHNQAPDTHHPIHLNGHQFSVIQSPGQQAPNYNNPPRRDVVDSGSLGDTVIIQFTANNAGPWILFDHIAWHRVAGFSLVLYVSKPFFRLPDLTSSHFSIEDSPANIRASTTPPKGWNSLAVCSAVTTMPAGWSKAYTCALDGDARVFAGASVYKPDNNTPAVCVDLCAREGYPLAGVEYSDECWCGSGYANNTAPTAVSSSECSMACAGDPHQTCGGSYRIQIYSMPSSGSLPTGWQTTYACAVDTPGPRIMDEAALYELSNNTPAVCATLCASKGYSLAGVEYSNEYWCSSGYTSNLAPTMAPTGDCNMPCSGASNQKCGGPYRIQMYGIKHLSPSLPKGWKTLYACAIDGNTRIFTGSALYKLDNNSPAVCAALCASIGYSMAGVEYSDECWCGNSYNNNVLPTVAPTGDCNMQCSGDASHMCGSSYRVQVYGAVPSFHPTLPSGWSTAYACAVDGDARIFAAAALYKPDLNTPAVCVALCASKGYTLAGVEYADECWCDNSYSNNVAPTMAPLRECGMPCPGYTLGMCGGPYRIQVYHAA